MIYLLVFILLLIPVVKYDWMAKTGGEKIWYYFSLVVLILLAGLRYRIGGDTLMYMAMYDEWPSINELKYFNFDDAEYQPLWYILTAICKSFSDDFVFFQLFHAAIVNSIFFYFFRKYCPQYYFSAILIYFFGYYCYLNMGVMREVLCISLLLLGTSLLLQKKWLLYYIVCIIAYFIHLSALIMIAFPFAIWIFRKPLWKIQIIIYTLIILLLNIVNVPLIVLNSLSVDGQLSRLILSYIESSPNIFGLISQLLLYLPILGLAYLREKNHIHDRYDFTFIVMSSVVLYACSMSIVGFGRFLNYFAPYLIVYIVNTLYRIIYLEINKHQVSYLVLFCTLTIYFFNLSYFYLRDMSDYYPNTRNYIQFSPYNSVIDKEINEQRERFIENYRDVQIQF